MAPAYRNTGLLQRWTAGSLGADKLRGIDRKVPGGSERATGRYPHSAPKTCAGGSGAQLTGWAGGTEDGTMPGRTFRVTGRETEWLVTWQ